MDCDAIAERHYRRMLRNPKAATLYAEAKAFVREVRGQASPQDVAGACERLMAQGARQFANGVFTAFPDARRTLNTRRIEKLARGNSGWSEVDFFASAVSGPAHLEGQITDACLMRWSASQNLWERRLALATTTVLNTKSRGGYGATSLTIAICETAVNDREDMVVKALSWALRALAPWNPPAVESFLDRHGDALAARVQREVRNKLDTGLKNPKRRSA